MPGSDLFGTIALRKGLLSEDALYRVLRFQEEVHALGLAMPLGEICRMHGALTAEQIDLVLELQALNERARRERRFGVTAVANGFVRADQLDEALAAAQRQAFRKPLAELLLEAGALTPQAARAIERAIATREALREAAGGSKTERLAQQIDVAPDAAEGLEQRVADTLLAAVALREGQLLVPELARCLHEQLAQAEPPPLAQVLEERGVLDPDAVAALEAQVTAAREERLTIPGYELLEVLGGGVTSIVLRAKHALLDREVAIKLVRADRVEQHAARMLEEAKAVARLRHPNVVGLYEVGRVHRRLYFVMELVDGPTLLEVIRDRGPLPEERALRVALDVVLALGAIDEASLVHRDVKPGNIVMTRDGPAKLTDLGLALDRRNPDRDEPDAIYGTPHTMSPEQAHGDPVDIRADLYGLGATLYHALIGQPPYAGEQPMEVLLAHLTEPVPDPREARPELSDATAALVMRLLAKNAADRPADPAAAAREISAAIADYRARSSTTQTPSS